MLRIAFVGHSQIPRRFNFPEAHVQLFRSPGARAYSFLEDPSMSNVLQWEHDLTFVWIGSNDITSSTNPGEIFSHIVEICDAIEDACHSTVYVCQVEPRRSTRNVPPEQYKRIQCGINNRIKKKYKARNIHFNSMQFVEELAEDGVHWSEAGRERVESKFMKVIQGFIGENDANE